MPKNFFISRKDIIFTYYLSFHKKTIFLCEAHDFEFLQKALKIFCNFIKKEKFGTKLLDFTENFHRNDCFKIVKNKIENFHEKCVFQIEKSFTKFSQKNAF